MWAIYSNSFYIDFFFLQRSYLKNTRFSCVFWIKYDFKKHASLGELLSRMPHQSPQWIWGKSFSTQVWKNAGGVEPFSSHSVWNEQAKLFGRDQWPLTRVVTPGLCICETLKHINIAMQKAARDFTLVLCSTSAKNILQITQRHHVTPFRYKMWQNLLHLIRDEALIIIRKCFYLMPICCLTSELRWFIYLTD